ncbi:MAG: radical SAM protein [Spirochaetaceae bacterium]|jgi:MoaA/NifB/PqqE/SkfB family radical SAM enzyme|nr:radical SAM protein [Spirochaetaceae bacterium]
MSFRKNYNIAKNYILNRLKFTEFAITNACVAKCSFCEIWKQQPKVFVDKEKALTTIDRLADFGVGHLTITGGEPLLHKNVIDFVVRATKRNMNNAILNAAPELLMKNDMPKRLYDAGCDLLSISFDSGDPVTMAESRQIPDIMEQMTRAMETIKKSRLKTMASVLIWNDNYNKLEEVCQRAKNMGYDFISLNYPTFSKSQVYPLGGEGISLSRDKVIFGLKEAIRLKKTGKYGIINQTPSMKNIINYLENPESVRFPCRGGSHVLFVDWFFDVRPCMQLPQVLGNILTMDEKDLQKSSCNACNMSWYRDFSMLFCGLRSIPVLVNSFLDSRDVLLAKQTKPE